MGTELIIMNTICYEDDRIVIFDASTVKHPDVEVIISTIDKNKVLDGGPKWCPAKRPGGKTYIMRYVKNVRQRINRFIMDVSSINQVDHISGNTLDNRRENLRVASNTENQRNRILSKKNTSGFKGVYWNKSMNRWLTQIRVNNKKKHIGYFENITEAAKAYDLAALEYHGAFAKTNHDLGLFPK